MTSLLTVLLLAASPLASSRHRVAVVVGANKAPPGRQPLRFAHRDAEAVKDVLIRVGGVEPENVTMLLDGTPQTVLAALDQAAAGLRPNQQSVVFFYYSGHADETSLYPGGARLSIHDVQTHLSKVPASVRVGIFDACRGGAWTRAKGLTAGAPIELPLGEALGAEGTLLFASSSGLEESHESQTLEQSFFTHHLVAGLAGAADVSEDGVVTANEAFQYARRLTVRDSIEASVVPQHPSFEVTLRGRDDFELTRPRLSASTLLIAQKNGPLQVVALSSGLVLFELPAGPMEARLAVAPGGYVVRSVAAGVVKAVREVQIRPGQPTAVDEASLSTVHAVASAVKSATLETPLVDLSTLPAETLQIGLRGGVALAPRDLIEDGFIQPGAGDRLRAAIQPRLYWAPTDWLELAPLQLGVTARAGRWHGLEALFSIGLDRWGIFDSSIDRTRFSATPNVTVAGRFWFSPSAALAVTTRAMFFFMPQNAQPETDLEGALLFTQVFKGRVSLNLGATAAYDATYNRFSILLGGSKLGQRAFPLLQVHLDDTWSIDADAKVAINPDAPAVVQQLYSAGFSAAL